MKKILCFVLAVLCAVLTSCGNRSLGLGNFEFKKVHVDSFHYSGCAVREDAEKALAERGKE